MNDQDFRKIFEKHRIDIPNDGFSEHVIRHLPQRKNLLPQVVMTVCVMVGLILALAIQGTTPLLYQMDNLVTSISNMQIPSIASITAYLGGVALLGMIGYSLSRVMNYEI